MPFWFWSSSFMGTDRMGQSVLMPTINESYHRDSNQSHNSGPNFGPNMIVTHREPGCIRLGRHYSDVGYVDEATCRPFDAVRSLMANAGFLVVAGELRVGEFA